jgi:hypothetical protein
LPWGGKWASSSVGMPMRVIWASSSGTSSTRSVSMDWLLAHTASLPDLANSVQI